MIKHALPILWIIVIILVISNLGLLYGINTMRLAALAALDQTQSLLSGLEQEVVIYEVAIDQAIPIQASVPFRRQMDIPVNTIIPIDQTFTVPVQTPAGEVTMTLPLQTNFPVDVVVPLNLDENIDLDTTIHLKTSIPVHIDINQTQLVDYLRTSRAHLLKLQHLLSFGANNTEPVMASIEPLPADRADVAPVDLAPTDHESSATQPTPDQPAQSQAPASVITNGSDATLPSFSVQENQPELGACRHDYWPLRPNTRWTYVGEDTAYDQTVAWVRNNQMHLTTQYEQQTVEIDVACQQEGIGGTYLGDLRRIRELGDFTFAKPQGVFLPPAEFLEQDLFQWQQALDVGGTVYASWQNTRIEGQITQGQVIARYETQPSENLQTPLGFRETIPIRQDIRFDLVIGYEIEEQLVLVDQTIELTTWYWLAKGIGLTKAHWQGGQMQLQPRTSQQPPIHVEVEISALAPEQLVTVCFANSQGEMTCRHLPNQPVATQAAKSLSKLEIRYPILPAAVLPIAVTDEALIVGSSIIAEQSPAANLVSNATETIATSEDTALQAYVIAINLLSDEVIASLQNFQNTAIAYGETRISRDQFYQEFQASKSATQRIVSKFESLTPPPLATAIHPNFNIALNKCTQAKNLLEDWFHAGDGSERDTGVRLYAECINILATAKSDVNALLN